MKLLTSIVKESFRYGDLIITWVIYFWEKYFGQYWFTSGGGEDGNGDLLLRTALFWWL